MWSVEYHVTTPSYVAMATSAQDCPRCTEGRMRLVRDASYSKDEMVWKCTNRKCNKKVSMRKGSWLEGSHLTLEQILKFTYMWVWRCDQEFIIMRECHAPLLLIGVALQGRCVLQF